MTYINSILLILRESLYLGDITLKCHHDDFGGEGTYTPWSFRAMSGCFSGIV
jgi:hypothetical protein